MTAARKVSAAIPESDPLWQKFINAPFDPEAAPEVERLGLEQARAGGFVDGAAVTAEIARRARAEGATQSPKKAARRAR